MYDGNLIKGLTDMVVAVTDTHHTSSTSVVEADNCEHCHASYGHYVYCPLLNRNTAEALSALSGNASREEVLRAHALGIKL